MEWLKQFTDEIEYLFEETEARLAELPAPLDKAALAYLGAIRAARAQQRDNYICYLLPYWLEEITGAHRDLCRATATANLLGMLSFLIQDDIADGAAPSSKTLVPLANMCQLRWQSVYRGLFPGSSVFWTYYDKYIAEWAVATATEHNNYRVPVNLRRLAHRASPVKVSIAALCVQTGNMALIPLLEEAVDLTLTTLQMADDWADWPEDLSVGNENSLLSVIGQQLFSRQEPVTIESINRAIHVRGELHRYTTIAAEQLALYQSLQVNIPYLYQFHQHIIDDMLRITADIDLTRDQLLEGGLQHWFAKQIES